MIDVCGKAKRLLILLGFALVAILLMACGDSATPSRSDSAAGASGEERVLKVALVWLDEPPDPYKAGWLAVPTGLAETLFRLNSSLKPEPWLASGAMQIDPLTWEVTLREGVKFHNGALMDAEKVKGSLELALLRRPGNRTLLGIESIEVKDSATLTVVTNAPKPTLPGLLTNQNTSIADPDTVPESVDDSASGAAMTGPYKMVSFSADVSMTLEAHTEYWGGRPAVDRIEYVAISESNSRMLALQSGDVDISVNLPPQGAAVVGNDASLEVKIATPSSMNFLFVNHESPAMQDVLVRQAITTAIDRQALVDSLAEGNAVAASTIFPPGFLSCSSINGYKYDPVAARKLLKEAGYEDNNGDGIVERDGQPLELVLQTYPERPLLPPMLVAVQSMLKDIGVGSDVQIVDYTLASQGGYDLFGYQNSTITTGDPHWALSRQYLTGGDENRGNFSSPKVDELIGLLADTADTGQRQQAACEALKAGHDEVALIPVIFPNLLYGISNQVNWPGEPHPVYLYFIDNKIGLK
jgi:peptide/nickel transport system substrate-binding protein